jgi:hypothetical protein
MKGPGILWMLQTAAGFSLAGPLFYLSGSNLLSGEYVWGAGFLFFGLLVLYFPTYLVNRISGRIRRPFGRGSSETGTDESSDDGDDETSADDRSASGPRATLERLRSR